LRAAIEWSPQGLISELAIDILNICCIVEFLECGNTSRDKADIHRESEFIHRDIMMQIIAVY
jgi:hypothetical protein